MLVANKSDGTSLSLGERWEKSDLIEIRSREKFHCPECGEEVAMKLGSKKIWHFSHLAGGSCQYEYDRESEYHLSGKLQLFNWLKKQGIQAELEHFDQQMKQKPDIAFKLQNQKYAIEFQCSVIPEEIFVKRTETYLHYGVIPIWIAAETLVKRKKHNIVSMNNFLYLFIRQTRNSWNIPAFCPMLGQFINLNGTIPITSKKTITNMVVNSLHQYSVENLLSPIDTPFPILKIWLAENQKLKSRYVTSPGAWQNPFLKELYRNHLSILTLPSEIGLPVRSSPYIETPSLIWQTFLYIDVFRHYEKGDIILYAKIRDAFNRRVRRKEIKLRTLPVARQKDHWYALAEYVFLLTKVSYLERINSGKVRVLRKIIIPGTIDEQINSEANFFNKYRNEIIQSIFH
ncbi:competence protein CoiA family protein [Mesobacillus subterraneus]|uniref:competence protein CoiA n=1 Tax=Mesobacillus subterraneus TaxID=285983 RepID=UPI001CFD1237|nr:competence protein CoiA family protein [Mesobacillus subterraneus]WLR53823.1 competence protein CoiA family protein [Mesobacillus subterraneus]